MTVRAGKVTFTDWISLPMRGQFTDTFIFRISASACLPPFAYAPLLKKMIIHLRERRSCASLWIQVDGPGEWFLLEVRNSLRGLKIPHVVSRRDDVVQFADFSFSPRLMPADLQPPPGLEIPLPALSCEDIRCLQALGRMKMGRVDEIASLAGLPVTDTSVLVAGLEKRKLLAAVAVDGETEIIHSASPPYWQLKKKGLFVALRSWDVPKGIQFSARREEHPAQIGTKHRHKSRIWSAWLQAAYPHAVIWAAWSEVRMPETKVVPDGLAWGLIHGYETLFWLEVGDEHKSRKRISEITAIRLKRALELCNRTGVNLVYVQLGPRWVCDAVRWGCIHLPNEVAVVLGDRRTFGKLPVVEWGVVT